MSPSPVADVPHGWCPDVIAALDWMRLVELVRALAAHGGCELLGSRVLIDGSVVFGMIENARTPYASRALVKLAPWNLWGATPESIEQFAAEVRTVRGARGILVAPGGASPATVQRARELQIELVDAGTLDVVLAQLPAENSEFFFIVATAGDCWAPTCPVCLRKLTRMVVQEAREDAIEPQRVFDASTMVADPVMCERLYVAPGCEVQFLQEVRAREIRIDGDATGDFVCHGTLALTSGARLTGTVAARAVKVEDGAELMGRTRILQGDLGPLNACRPRWEWRCTRQDGRPDCAKVRFEPHESAVAVK